MLQSCQKSMVCVGGVAVAADLRDSVILQRLDEVLDSVRVDETVAVDADDYLAGGLGSSRSKGNPFAEVLLVPDQEEPRVECRVLFKPLENVPSLIGASIVNDRYVQPGRGVVAVENGSNDRFYRTLLVLRRYDHGDFGPVA